MTSPIFIHSLFRAGSTYIFKVFRRSPNGYWCYQEPLHETAFLARNSPDNLLAFTNDLKDHLRHPDIGNSYFYELHEVYDAWKDIISEDIIYQNYFNIGNNEDLIRYFSALIDSAKGIPVIQECRTSNRIAPLKKHFQGTHIYLWRNPWDQWWSYKTTDYFDTIDQLILNSNMIPDVIHRLRLEIGFNPYQSHGIIDELTYYYSRRLSPEESYMVFYTLWCLGLIEGMEHADVLMNIDALSNQAIYRQETLKTLELRGISNINLDDCQVTQTYYVEQDRAFFRKIEDRVHGLLLMSHYPQEIIDQISGLRQEFEPEISKLSPEEISPELLVENAVRAREFVKRIEQRESAHLAHAEATITKLKTREYEANERAERVEVEAKGTAARVEMQAREANARAERAVAQASEATARAEQLSTVLREVYDSHSWRITHPLRLLGGFARQLLQAMLEFTLSRPSLRKTALSLLSHLPFLKSKLKLFAEANRRAEPLYTETRRSVQHEISPGAGILKYDSSAQFKPTPPTIFPLSSGYRNIYYYVDHTILCPVNTGMQRVARRLGRALLKAGERVTFVKWDAQSHRFILLNQSELVYLSQWHGPLLSFQALQQYPTQNGDPVTIGKHDLEEGNWLIIPEVTHITYQPQPMTLNVLTEAKRQGLKTAFMFYDALPLKQADLHEMAAKHETYMQQLLLADLVIPISNWSAGDLVAFLQVHEGADLTPTPRITAIPLPGESQQASRVTKPTQPGSTSKLILSVGSIVPHKNQVALAHAFDRYCEIYPDTDWQLHLVGNLHPNLANEIYRATEQNSRIKYLHDIPDDELEKLYRTCSFTVFPSIEEGFGLPILESLWYGKPCICANFGSMAEVAEGGGCLTVNTREIDEILQAIIRLTMEKDLLEQLSQEAITRTITSWDDYSDQFRKLLDEVGNPLNQVGVIYYWADHTSTFYKNTGIQRVTRGLARALMELGLKLIPVKWDENGHQFCQLSEDELAHLAQWNGPKSSDWSAWIDPALASACDWVLIPELTTYLRQTRLADIKRYTATLKLRTAIIFYDAIPYKMPEIYPKEAWYAHEQYMEDLNEFDLIMAISQHSRNDLISFLSAIQRRTYSLEDRIQASVLPGEFLESERITNIKQEVSTGIKILCVGTIEPRKNHLVLLQAFSQVVKQAKKQVELIIVGRTPFPELANQVQHFIDTVPGIRWEKSANDAELRQLYAECDFTIYPSLEEGFGLPILESLWYARPCICRDFSAMAEAAEGGGCLMVETADPKALADAILTMVENDTLRLKLAQEAVTRPFKTWREYAREVAMRLATERYIPLQQDLPESATKAEFYGKFVNLQPRPLLSVCISTYNRAEWLSVSLKNLSRLLPNPNAEVEIVVCDNTSSDHTPDVVQPYLHRADFRYYRNPVNVGMLGNLRVTAHHASGRYVWILGDDDLVKPGSIEKVLQVIKAHPDLALIYLNYAYTRQDDAKSVIDLDAFLNDSTPIVPVGEDIAGPVSRICAESENFFTAIYCLVYRRDHALRAYTQNTEGRPFSTLLTCIPTTYYTLNFMMNEPAYWVGEPQLVVNLNVSWMKYAPLWILERIPEVYDLAERLGADPQAVDRWRNHTLPGIVHWFRDIYAHDEVGNMQYFSPSRLLSRIKHLDRFPEKARELQIIYENAYAAGHPGAKIPPSQVFSSLIAEHQ